MWTPTKLFNYLSTSLIHRISIAADLLCHHSLAIEREIPFHEAKGIAYEKLIRKTGGLRHLGARQW